MLSDNCLKLKMVKNTSQYLTPKILHFAERDHYYEANFRITIKASFFITQSDMYSKKSQKQLSMQFYF
jgi:hypothetical protein